MYVNNTEIEVEYGYGERSPYPIIQWGYGNKQLSSRGLNGMSGDGGFFIAESNLPSRSDFDKEAFIKALLANGWVEDSFETEGDKPQTVKGWYKGFVLINQVAHRKRSFAKASDGKSVFGSFDYVAAQAGRENVRSQYQALVSIPGLEAFAPFVLTMKVSAAIAYEGNRNEPGVLNTFLGEVVRKVDTAICEANKIPMRRVIPLFEFDLPVGVDIDTKGKVIFKQKGTGDKSKFLSLPTMIGVKPQPSDEDIHKMMISDDRRAHLLGIAEKSKEWMEAWATNSTEDNGKSAAQPAQVAVPEGM
jgi:hypothetical protein